MYDTPLPRNNQLEIIGINMGTYKVRNEINENETKSTKDQILSSPDERQTCVGSSLAS
jgi:hypothetical protein